MNNRKIDEYFDRLPGRGAGFCFNGLLRNFCAEDKIWTSIWSSFSGLNFDWSEAIAYDIFGIVYTLGDLNQVYIFSLDSGDKSSLEVNLDEFFDAIKCDSVSTIRSDVYEDAVSRLGRPNNYLISPDLQPPVAGSAPRWVDAAVTLKPTRWRDEHQCGAVPGWIVDA